MIFNSKQAQECDLFWNSRKIKRGYQVKGLLNYLPQKPFLPKDLKLDALAIQFNIPKKEIIYHFPELEWAFTQKVGSLSGGEERLIAIVLIILSPVHFSLLDEPFTHIMPLYIERILRLLILKKTSKGFIITDHQYETVLQICDQLYFMKEGSSFLLKNSSDLAMQGYLSQ